MRKYIRTPARRAIFAPGVKTRGVKGVTAYKSHTAPVDDVACANATRIIFSLGKLERI